MTLSCVSGRSRGAGGVGGGGRGRGSMIRPHGVIFFFSKATASVWKKNYIYIYTDSQHYIKWEKLKSIFFKISNHTNTPAFSLLNRMLEVLARNS